MARFRQTCRRASPTILAMNQIEKARRFRELHAAGTFVLQNAWDAGSAILLAGTATPAIATTSSGVSWAHGVRDGQQLSRDEAIAALARIVRAVDCPVSADLESGYGPEPGDVAATVAAAIAAGAVGANLEDRPGSGPGGLRTIGDQCARLAAARDAADRSGVPFVLNARTDVYLAQVGEPAERETLALERAAHYAGAGADCVFVPGLSDPGVIARLVKAAPVPVNVLLAPGSGVSVAQLAQTGVRRISTGHLIAAAAYATIQRAARELLDGEFGTLLGALPVAELQAAMP
jgi:2-methylisocitrate lyase-like PEP mutase family enzyme